MRHARKAVLLALAVSLALAGGATAQVDFTKYVALGDSLTAGYASSGLAKYYQDYSYPSIIALQGGVATFQQPLVADPGIAPVLILQRLAPLTIVPSGTAYGAPLNATLSGPYNNLGIPGANVGDLLTRTGDIRRLATGQSTSATIMYDLILRDNTNPAIAQAIGAAGTFYTVWAGNNDVLRSVLAGLVLDGVTLTPVATFQTQYTQLLGALKQNRPAAKIIVANIPDVTTIPFATTLKPYNFTPAGQKFYYLGEAGPLTDADYVTLGASSLLALGYGIPGTGRLLPEGSIDATGLHAGVILRGSEIAAARARVRDLNQVISTVATAVGAPVLDANAILADIAAHGMVIGGVKVSASFLTGGIFSYDGVHPQRLGYAIVANEFIKAINANLGSKLPLVNLRPFVLGATATTTEAAGEVIFSRAAYESLLRTFVPEAKTDRFDAPRPIRRRGPSAQREPIDPAAP